MKKILFISFVFSTAVFSQTLTKVTANYGFSFLLIDAEKKIMSAKS